MAHFRNWAHPNLKPDDAIVLETTGNVWDIYDIVAPLVSKTIVAHAGKVRQIAEASVKTDKEDVKRLLTVLIGNIVPDPQRGSLETGEAFPAVWVPPTHVRELRSLISFRWRVSKQITTLAPAQTAGAVQVCPKTDFTVWANVSISSPRMASCSRTKTCLGGISSNSRISPVSRSCMIFKALLILKIKKPLSIRNSLNSATLNPGLPRGLI